MSTQKQARQKKPAQRVRTAAKIRRPVSNRPALTPDSSAAEDLELVRQSSQAGSQANAKLRQETILRLQRQHGNAYVQRLVTGGAVTRPKSRRSQNVIARREDEPAAAGARLVRADAASLVASQYPALKLPPAKVATLQKILNARYKVLLLARKAARYPKNGLSSQVRKREAIERRMGPYQDILRDHYYPVYRTEGLAVKTELVLGDDILGDQKKQSAAVNAFRSSLYNALAERKKMVLVINDGANPKPLFKFMWGRRELSQQGGQVKFNDLMKIMTFNLAYQKVLMGRVVELSGKLVKEARAYGGKYYNGYGKKIGETYGKWWNTTVKLGMELGRLGGYVPDAQGEREMQAVMNNAATAKAVVKAPDGWLHVFALKPPITSLDMKEPGNDGYVYLLNKGAQVIPERIVTKDGKELHRATGDAGPGWRTHMTMTEGEQFAVGAIFGDLVEDPSVTMMVGQMLMGLIPVFGQLADIRDIAAGIYKMWKTGGKDGKLQTFLALIAIVPLLGDGIKLAKKALARGGRTAAIRAFVTKLRPAIGDATGELARKLVANPKAVAKKIGLSTTELATESRKLSALAAEAVTEGGKNSAERYAREMEGLFNKVGGDASAVVALGGGYWKTVAKALAASPTGTQLGKKMQVWRLKQISTMEEEVKRLVSGFGTDIPGGAPKMSKTGTQAFKSDIDISFFGPNSSVHRNAAIKTMETRFGSGWRELLDADIFADPRRLTMFEGAMAKLPPRKARALEKRLVADSELNVLAKMLVKGGDEAAVKKLAKTLGVRMPEVTKRAGELKGLTKNKILKLELKLDVMHRRFLRTESPKKRAMIAEEMSKIQGRLNAIVEGPYLTPGGVSKHVTRREMKMRPMGRMGRFKQMSPAMLYMAFLDDFYMLQGVLAKVKKVGFTEGTAKSMAKYSDRLLISAGQIGGIDVAKVKASRALFDNMEGLLRRSRLEKTDPPTEVVARIFDEARKGLMATMESMSAKAKHRSGTPRGTTRYIIKLGRILLREISILARFEVRRGTSPTSSAK